MNIYIEQFDGQVQNTDLAKFFQPFGEVQSATVEIDAFTNLSRRFGFVEMPHEEEAKAAITALDQSELNGCRVTVKEAPPKEIKKGSYKVGGGSINPYRFRKN